MKKVRLDDLLVERGFFSDRDGAMRAVYAHEVKVDDAYPSSPATMVTVDAAIACKAHRKYVSRGGHKLKGALDHFGIDVSGKRCLDIGSSTGGFTDCLLQAGAAEVACVDVNYGQLAWQIRTNPHVSVFERTNIKLVEPESIGAPFDIIVIDVSFIGLASLAQVIARFAEVGTELIALVKPQFESAHEETDHGIVKDPDVRLRTVAEVQDAFVDAGFDVVGFDESQLKGHKGNIEYLVYAVYR